jgi:hypothetical protein
VRDGACEGFYAYGEAFSSLRPKERVWGVSLSDRILTLSSLVSYAKATNLCNRFLHRGEDDALCTKTVKDFVERTGTRLDAEYDKASEAILRANKIDDATGIPDKSSPVIKKAKDAAVHTADRDKVAEVARLYNEKREGTARIPEHLMETLPEGKPEQCVYVYVDDVLVKHQKECRGPAHKRDTRFISNTVISIQHGDKRFDITAKDMDQAFKRLMAFLLANNLAGRQLVFITDGATEIKEHVGRFFAFMPYTLYLDWHHLQKKCYQQLSSALKCGKAMRDDKDRIERELYGILWAGNVKGALEYISAIGQKYIKSQDALDKLTTYIERKSEHIPCYAIRKGLGLHNSSNPVEKANDLLVAQRQKGKGMAWSVEGSHALATITVAERNAERYDMLIGKAPRFAFAA